VKKCNNSGRTEYGEWECKDLCSSNDSRADHPVYTRPNHIDGFNSAL